MNRIEIGLRRNCHRIFLPSPFSSAKSRLPLGLIRIYPSDTVTTNPSQIVDSAVEAMAKNRRVFINLNERHLRVIEYLVRGMSRREIAKAEGTSYGAIHGVMCQLYAKTGFHDVKELTQWAIENALDAPIPDTPENMPAPERKPSKPRIRMGRIRRAMKFEKGR